MDDSRSFTDASIESLKNDLAHRLAHSQREYIDVAMRYYIGCLKSGSLLQKLLHNYVKLEHTTNLRNVMVCDKLGASYFEN